MTICGRVARMTTKIPVSVSLDLHSCFFSITSLQLSKEAKKKNETIQPQLSS